MFSIAKRSSLWLACLGAAVLCTGTAFAQDNKALIDALIKKGILTNDEATQIEKDLAKNNAAIDASTSKGKYLEKLTISGRFQVQYAGLGTGIDGAAANPPSTEHFFLRRMYLGAEAVLSQGFTGTFNYDFANASFDKAYITWKQSDALAIDVGFRKVPLAYDEFTSSSDIRAIERSPVTRYFVESNNGRRLGAASYRTGVYLGGTQNGVFYNVAVTNPERDEFSSLTGNSDPGVQGAGTKANNNLSYWGNLGYGGKFDGGTYKFGASAGFLPDQGGKTLGAGDNLSVYDVYTDIQVGGFNFRGEYLWADNPHGVSATVDAKPTGYYLQPTYRVGDFEGVVRYSSLDSDGRGVDLSDGVRSAPSGGTMNKLNEWFIGGNWYIRGNDVKWQLGYIHAETKDTITGGVAQAKTDGVRSQMQLNF
jgi:phosphate-selective porin